MKVEGQSSDAVEFAARLFLQEHRRLRRQLDFLGLGCILGAKPECGVLMKIETVDIDRYYHVNFRQL